MEDNDRSGPMELASVWNQPQKTDFSRYLGEVSEIEATDEQKMELLGVIYSIMRSFVELEFDVEAADIWQSISSDTDSTAESEVSHED